ncbi:hypothetical protein A0H76_779 [Hepatospora eriocheir]|uniref:Uncharacterized protein n=1 Tax=Hepatospora eriocheir TaxID=1081669 RepID=A0A1X0Q6W7_9MICR|nr:hypothetical protein A0H76_779 [Hepatospora eriocheir]
MKIYIRLTNMILLWQKYSSTIRTILRNVWTIPINLKFFNKTYSINKFIIIIVMINVQSHLSIYFQILLKLLSVKIKN